MSEVDIFADLSETEMAAIAAAAPMRQFGPGEVLYSPAQQMHDNFAEALEKVTVCVMSRADVQRFLLSDARIAARISEILGNRV